LLDVARRAAHPGEKRLALDRRARRGFVTHYVVMRDGLRVNHFLTAKRAWHWAAKDARARKAAAS
jgi:hypothetical protein